MILNRYLPTVLLTKSLVVTQHNSLLVLQQLLTIAVLQLSLLYLAIRRTSVDATGEEQGPITLPMLVTIQPLACRYTLIRLSLPRYLIIVLMELLRSVAIRQHLFVLLTSRRIMNADRFLLSALPDKSRLADASAPRYSITLPKVAD